MDTRYFSFVGYSGSGKTHIIEEVVKFLRAKKYRVGVIKYIHHPGFGIDIKGKDTTKFAEAGANIISYVAPESSGIIYRGKEIRDKIFKLIDDDVDYIILEGFPHLDYIPRIVLIKERGDIDKFVDHNTIGIHSHRLDLKDHELYVEKKNIPELVEKYAYPKIPMLNCRKCGYNSCREFYHNFLDNNVKLSTCAVRGIDDAKLYINKKEIPLNKFTANMVKNVIKGITDSLTKPDKSLKEVQIKLDY
ncbi:MAG: molybdopterin-guanine dinucleotide biosynthesis protein B [Candidatus Lokiarchaeota archaeon]|nr:molybdopterin-guanine dinucleotide biosynthesis protein B [Candidatus Lokiarchaeota archaeon]